MNSTLFCALFWALFGASLWLLAPTSLAQDEEVPEPQAEEAEIRVGQPLFAGNNAFQLMGNFFPEPKEIREALAERIDLELNVMKRQCTLREDQLSKLTLIGKGVVDRHMKKIEKAMADGENDGGNGAAALQFFVGGAQANGIVLEVGDDAVATLIEDVEVAEDDVVVEDVEVAEDDVAVEEIQGGDVDAIAAGNEVVAINLAPALPPGVVNGQPRVINIRQMNLMSQNPEKTLRKDAIWKKTLTKVLDDTQKQKWEHWEAQRRHYRINTAVKSVVLELDETLLLDQMQREALEALIMKNCPASLGNEAREAIPFEVKMRADSLGKEALAKILGEGQMAAWTKMRRNGNAMQNFFDINVGGAQGGAWMGVDQ